jgi:acetyl esterase/lipase
MKCGLIRFLVLLAVCLALTPVRGERLAYHAELNIPYCSVDGRTLVLNAFLPDKADGPVPAMVYFYGGWWFGGGVARDLQGVPDWGVYADRGVAVFSNQYRLGRDGGFPQNIRDCRNAIRYIRKHAREFNIDPDRIACTGISAGGYLTYMVTLAPEDFDDGGPTEELAGVSARVCGGFGYVGPTDFVSAWAAAPSDEVTDANGKVTFRAPDGKIPDDYRPRLRILFHGASPDTGEGRALYARVSPVNLARGDVPPILICDGEKDPIVPGQPGRVLFEKLRAAGADATYWVTPGGGHAYPGGPGFRPVLDGFLDRIWKPGRNH